MPRRRRSRRPRQRRRKRHRCGPKPTRPRRRCRGRARKPSGCARRWTCASATTKSVGASPTGRLPKRPTNSSGCGRRHTGSGSALPALRADADRIAADAVRLRAKEDELLQWQQRNAEEKKTLSEQRAADEERLRLIDERDRRTSSEAKVCAGRVEALARAEAELVRKQQSADILLQDARRKAARLLQVEQERNAARKEVDDRDRAFNLLFDGIVRIQKGELASRRALEEDVSLKPIVGYLAPIIATVGMVQRRERDQAAGRIEKAERTAVAATARAVEAERKESLSAGTIETLRRSLDGLVGLLSKYKLGQELSDKVSAAQTVLTRLFGGKSPSLIEPQGKAGGNGLG